MRSERRQTRSYEYVVMAGGLTYTTSDASAALREYAKEKASTYWTTPPRMIRRIITEIDITPTEPPHAR